MLQTPLLSAIGTPSAPATLTDDYDDNKWVTTCRYLPNLHLDFDYVPLTGQSDRYIQIRIRYSNDGGTTWRERTLKSNSTTESKIYQSVPLVFPGSKLSTGGDTYSGVFDESGFFNDLLEVSVKEDSAGNHGTCFIGALLTDNLN